MNSDTEYDSLVSLPRLEAVRACACPDRTAVLQTLSAARGSPIEVDALAGELVACSGRDTEADARSAWAAALVHRILPRLDEIDGVRYDGVALIVTYDGNEHVEALLDFLVEDRG